MSAVMLTPGQFAIEHADVDARHFRYMVIQFVTDIVNAQEAEDLACGNGCHVAALVIEPVRIAFFRHAVADESKARCA